MHDIIGEQDAVSFDLLLLDDGITARFKEGARRDRGVRCVNLARNRRLQRVAEGSCDAAPLMVCMDVEMVEIARIVHVGKSDDRFAFNGDERQM